MANLHPHTYDSIYHKKTPLSIDPRIGGIRLLINNIVFGILNKNELDIIISL